MAEHGKRGPNGGTVDIDDPEEVFPPDRVSLVELEVREALKLAEWAARERIAGRDQNADSFLRRASDQLARVICAVASRDSLVQGPTKTPENSVPEEGDHA